MKNNQGISNILLILVALLILGVGGYLGYTYVKKPTETKAPATKEAFESTSQNTKPEIQTIQKPPNQKPTNEELVESIKKDLGINKDEEIIITRYEKSDNYEIVFAGYQAAGNLFSRQIGNGKWVLEQGQQQGPDMYECKILDKLGFPMMDCFNYDTQLKRENGVYKKL